MQQLPHGLAEGVNVAQVRRALEIAVISFWSDVIQRTAPMSDHTGSCTRRNASQLVSAPKVAQLCNRARSIQQNVPGFDVEVNDSELVRKYQGARNLLENIQLLI